jgi:hypothetical protein
VVFLLDPKFNRKSVMKEKSRLQTCFSCRLSAAAEADRVICANARHFQYFWIIPDVLHTVFGAS